MENNELQKAMKELAALREELANTRKAAKEELEGVKYTRRKFRQERDDLQQRLTAAEQRNSRHESMLRHFASCADVWRVGTLSMDYVAALKPTESGASE